MRCAAIWVYSAARIRSRRNGRSSIRYWATARRCTNIREAPGVRARPRDSSRATTAGSTRGVELTVRLNVARMAGAARPGGLSQGLGAAAVRPAAVRPAAAPPGAVLESDAAAAAAAATVVAVAAAAVVVAAATPAPAAHGRVAQKDRKST